MKRINKKSFLALGLMLGLGALSVAYAALSTTLTIQSGTETEPGVSVSPLVTFVGGGSVRLDGDSEGTPINQYVSEINPNDIVPGNVTISDSRLEATISGTAFSSEGTVVYALCLENNYNGTVYLAETPNVTITDVEGKILNPAGIEVKLSYYRGGNKEGNNENDLVQGTELTAGQKKMLYVAIDVKEMPKTPTNFNFTFSPKWTTVKPPENA